jgi:hypothetical protein
MLTVEEFDNWLYNPKAPHTITLCEGHFPERIAERDPEFARVYGHVLYWANRTFVQIEQDGRYWIVRSKITPKR